jgi:hypothetical protein
MKSLTFWQIEMIPWYLFAAHWATTWLRVKRTKTAETFASRLTTIPMVLAFELLFSWRGVLAVLVMWAAHSYKALREEALLQTDSGRNTRPAGEPQDSCFRASGEAVPIQCVSSFLAFTSRFTNGRSGAILLRNAGGAAPQAGEALGHPMVFGEESRQKIVVTSSIRFVHCLFRFIIRNECSRVVAYGLIQCAQHGERGRVFAHGTALAQPRASTSFFSRRNNSANCPAQYPRQVDAQLRYASRAAPSSAFLSNTIPLVT